LQPAGQQHQQLVIEVDHLTKEFKSLKGPPVRALEDVSFGVREAEFVGLIGPSGCGKTSLLKIVMGLIQATSGDVLIDGKKPSARDENIGFVLQTPTLFPWRTVIDNVLIPIDVKKFNKRNYVSAARELLSTVGLADFADKYPFELSGGMQQRASIARALIHKPRILLLDEPFGQLDAITREQMGLELQDVWTKYRVTALLVTHDISEAVFLSDRVLVMAPRPGRIVADLAITLPRPRTLDMKSESSFARYAREIRNQLGLNQAA
jgi:NitT/TauT family transport system ATP-binding protein